VCVQGPIIKCRTICQVPRTLGLDSSFVIVLLGFLAGGGETDRFLLTGEDGFDVRDPWFANMAMIPSFRSDIGSMNVDDSLPTFPTSGDTG
jgi:hypothetical protein